MSFRAVLWLLALIGALGLPVGTRLLIVEGQERSDPIVVAAQRALDDDVGGTVCKAIQVSGTNFIVATLDYGRTTRFCNEIATIEAGPSPKVIDRINGWGVGDVREIVRDVNPVTGQFTLVVDQLLSSYEGARACTATFPDVYQCSSGKCVEDSKSRLDVYSGLLSELQSELASAQSAVETEGRFRLDCITMEADKVRRLLGMSPRAGYELAEQWMNSRDPQLRRKAIAVFSDIDDVSSRSHLQTLAKDPDRSVATVAVDRLKGKQ